MSPTSSEPRLQGSGNSRWSANGATTSPGPWKPLNAPLTLWPSEHSDTRSPHREATLNISSPPSTEHLSFTPFLSCSGWGLKTLILGPTFLLSWFPLLYPYRRPFPNQKRWPRWNQAASLAPLLPLRPLSADRWCPVPPEGWWCQSSPTPQSAAPEARQLGAPGLCGPTQGVTVEFPGPPPTACPEEPAVCPAGIQRGATLELLSLTSAEQFLISSEWNGRHYIRGAFLTMTVTLSVGDITPPWGKCNNIWWCVSSTGSNIWGWLWGCI